MLSIMQLRLREEYDMENAQAECGLFETDNENIYSYGIFEDMCMMEMEIFG